MSNGHDLVDDFLRSLVRVPPFEFDGNVGC